MAQEFTRNIKKLKKEQINDSIIKEFTDVNDLVSDDKDNYIKRPNETMHCLTDNIKKIETSNSLLTVSNQNDLNKSILTVNHDETKENVLTSERGTVSITRGEKTNIDVNIEKLKNELNLSPSPNNTIKSTHYIFNRDTKIGVVEIENEIIKVYFINNAEVNKNNIYTLDKPIDEKFNNVYLKSDYHSKYFKITLGSTIRIDYNYNQDEVVNLQGYYRAFSEDYKEFTSFMFGLVHIE